MRMVFLQVLFFINNKMLENLSVIIFYSKIITSTNKVGKVLCYTFNPVWVSVTGLLQKKSADFIESWCYMDGLAYQWEEWWTFAADPVLDTDYGWRGQINHTACTSHKFLYLQQLHIKYKGMQLTTKLRQPAVLKHQKPQGDQSPDNVKLHDNSTTFPWRFVTLLPMLSVTHIMPILVLLSVVGVEMKQCTTQNQNEMHKLSNVKNGCKYAANNKQF